MIQISDPQFHKTALEGALTLDRAEVVRLSLDIGADCWEGMIGDVVLAWGIEKEGRFIPFSSRDARYTDQVVMGPPERSHHFTTGDFLQCGRIHGDGKPANACSLIQAFLHWLEEALVESNKFGKDAKVICCRPKLLDV